MTKASPKGWCSRSAATWPGGRTVNEIADDLAISNKTVSSHKARLMEKTGFSSKAARVRYAVAHGLAN